MDKRLVDKIEQDMIAAEARGEFVPSPNADLLKSKLKQAASNYLRKDARTNIRISETDLMLLKIRAAEEGLPYQTLISSILHKFLNGKLIEHKNKISDVHPPSTNHATTYLPFLPTGTSYVTVGRASEDHFPSGWTKSNTSYTSNTSTTSVQ